MPTIRAYHRPATLEEALALLSHADLDATLLAGGTVVNARPAGHAIDVVDLQALGLDTIAADGDRLSFGAMTRLQAVSQSDRVPALLRELAHREAPSTLRNAATVGGTVAAGDPESEFLAGMLAYEAVVEIAHSIGSETLGLADLLADRSKLGLGIITSVSISVDGDAVAERTGRTPADRPIVMVVARRRGDSVLVALTGVAETPVLADPDAMDALSPPGDFRGSTAYRRDVAGVLVTRALARLGEAT